VPAGTPVVSTLRSKTEDDLPGIEIDGPVVMSDEGNPCTWMRNACAVGQLFSTVRGRVAFVFAGRLIADEVWAIAAAEHAMTRIAGRSRRAISAAKVRTFIPLPVKFSSCSYGRGPARPNEAFTNANTVPWIWKFPR
jgi:hypothetical protein